MMMCHNAADFPQGEGVDRAGPVGPASQCQGVLRALLPKGCELMPAVKANAYGHGRRWSPASFREQVSDLSAWHPPQRR